jgi:uncharacterized protein YecE (DUF72 family)
MIRIGTCSWKYESWKGIIYPDQEDFNYLQEYSKHYNSVEIDQWFWSLSEPKRANLPKHSDVESYSQSVPDNFKFTIKVPNAITLTHFYNKDKSKPLKVNPYFLDKHLFDSLLETINPMNKKIGLLMFQFEYLNKQKISSLSEFLDKFEAFIDSIDKTYFLGVEIRNPNFLKKPFFDFLKRNKLSMVFLQGYFMPPVWNTFNEFKNHLISPVVIRLHGPDRTGIEKKTGNKWDQIVEPKDEDIDKICEIIFYLNQKKVDAYINVNNHFEGSAPLTIKKIDEKLRYIK